jgi:signal peptidase I
MFIYAFVLPILVCISAYRCAKRIGGGIANESRIPQKPWLAVFLSLLLPGLGHLYLRKWRFMAVFFAAYIAITLVSRGFVYVAIRVILVTFLCTHVFLMCHPNYKEWIQKFIVFVLFLVCVNFIAFILRPWLVGKYIIQLTPNSVGTSMEPTIKAHDRLIVDKLCYRLHSPRTGDIVAIRLPEGFGTFAALHAEPPFFLAKRVVAVPGETVIIRDNEVYVNGKKQCGQDTKSKENNDKGYLSEGSMLESYEVFGVVEPYTVPRGYYFVLGDNMSDSIDSRHIGPIPRSDIVGRVIKIYWPPSRAGSLYQNK